MTHPALREAAPNRPGVILGMSGNRAGGQPRLFARHPGLVVRDGDPLPIDPSVGRIVAEGEVGIVIGRGGYKLDARHAEGAIAGWLLVNDITVLSPQHPEGDIQAGKGLATPMSCVIDGLPCEDDLVIEVWVNDVVRSRGSVGDLTLHATALVAWVSQTHRLLPGDVILCGAPADAVEVEVGDRVRVSAGELAVENPVVDLLSERVLPRA